MCTQNLVVLGKVLFLSLAIDWEGYCISSFKDPPQAVPIFMTSGKALPRVRVIVAVYCDLFLLLGSSPIFTSGSFLSCALMTPFFQEGVNIYSMWAISQNVSLHDGWRTLVEFSWIFEQHFQGSTRSASSNTSNINHHRLFQLDQIYSAKTQIF